MSETSLSLRRSLPLPRRCGVAVLAVRRTIELIGLRHAIGFTPPLRR